MVEDRLIVTWYRRALTTPNTMAFMSLLEPFARSGRWRKETGSLPKARSADSENVTLAETYTFLINRNQCQVPGTNSISAHVRREPFAEPAEIF